MLGVSDGRLVQVNVSAGGVPKLPVESARVTRDGVAGDRQRAVTVHGGPHRAVSILGIEAIRRVAAEGHPIAPGTTGENLTVSGFDVSSLPVGTRLAIGDDVVLELSSPTNPCRTIRHSFRDLRFGRLGVAAHPTDSRMYARVVAEGTVHPGDPIRLSPPAGDSADRFTINDRLDRVERESSVAFWEAARAAGVDVRIMDDGEVAAVSAPALPGIAFNVALGFAHLPNLVEMALDHFNAHGTAGWVMADEPPWPGAEADGTFARWAAGLDAIRESPLGDGVVIRELRRDEIGPWSAVVVEASALSPVVGRAWVALEEHLARVAHHHRFVAEVDGRAVAAGSVHTHRGVGWLRAGSVLAEYRGRGLQDALIRARVAHARRVGCDLVGASTIPDGASARNVERAGLRRVGTRRSYPTEPRP
jgi:MOSC domain-containing protein YiiM/ribosomal protein S18 acetylase RimI-like enzyme